jgi:hypothetical protein
MRKNRMKKAMGILTALLVLLAFSSAVAADRETYQEKFEKTVALAKDGKVYLSNISGDIEMKSWNQAQVKIDALKVSEASSLSKAQENAKLVTIEVISQDSVVRVETKYPKHASWHGEHVSVNYSVWIPDKASIEITSVSGDIKAEGIGGALGAKSVSGDVEIMKADKGADCESVSGDVKLQEITGDVDLHSVSGNVTISLIRGSIKAETVSGDVALAEVSEANVVKAKTISGEVTYQGKVNPAGRYTLDAHSGDVEMTLPSDSAFDLEAETFSGDIDSDFQIEVSGKISPKEIRGTVNKGGAYIRLSTFSGDIRLKKV